MSTADYGINAWSIEHSMREALEQSERDQFLGTGRKRRRHQKIVALIQGMDLRQEWMKSLAAEKKERAIARSGPQRSAKAPTAPIQTYDIG
ncbi:MAG: hypothetical protein IPI58_04135 [Alphaproteobacteria bacterium]|nr:MAG: hypothetical protein IPI58_04135 [Alphaproteobacteria bacterium]